MVEHPAIRSRVDNVVFVRFRHRAMANEPARTCRSCAHWCGDGGDGAGRCLADCGARLTTPDRSCAEWRRPPLLVVV